MILDKKPANFAPKFEITGSIIEYENRILLLHRQDHKPEGNTWGVPAGKRDAGEDVSDTISREVSEETGLVIANNQFHLLGTFYNRYLQYDFLFHLFTVQLQTQTAITINEKEHKGFRWITPQEALSLPLIEDLDFLLKRYYPHV